MNTLNTTTEMNETPHIPEAPKAPMHFHRVTEEGALYCASRRRAEGMTLRVGQQVLITGGPYLVGQTGTIERIDEAHYKVVTRGPIIYGPHDLDSPERRAQLLASDWVWCTAEELIVL